MSKEYDIIGIQMPMSWYVYGIPQILIATCQRELTYPGTDCQYRFMFTAFRAWEMQHYRWDSATHEITPERWPQYWSGALHNVPNLTCPLCKWDANKAIEPNTYQRNGETHNSSNGTGAHTKCNTQMQ